MRELHRKRFGERRPRGVAARAGESPDAPRLAGTVLFDRATGLLRQAPADDDPPS